jgi:hypothetical protein
MFSLFSILKKFGSIKLAKGLFVSLYKVYYYINMSKQKQLII